jgi:hypothetical protein
MAIRTHIAAAYLILAGTQLLALIAIDRASLDAARTMLLLALTAVTYLTIGQRVFAWASQVVYHHAVTAFILVLALMLLL